ncbi:hypothetical protein KGQ34_01675 [Patescibacteria group bacterium]|nr:hypothetical protein [Patescibacteria group bacterium]
MRAFLQYLKENSDVLLDMMIILGEELEHQPKEKREKFLSLLEKQIRRKIYFLEKDNRLLRKKVSRLEKEFAIIKNQYSCAKQNSA